ncbi:MAG: TlpA family protein disulfide reductase [Mariniblastus sp.]
MRTSKKFGWFFATSFGAAIALSGFGHDASQLQASTTVFQEESDDQEESKSDDADQDDDAKSEEKEEDDKPKKKKPKPKPKKGPEGTNIGERIKTISGKDVEGEKFSLDDYEGKVIMLDFWGDW